MTRYLGIDLAWGAGTAAKAANESGVVLLSGEGDILDAGWRVGLPAVVDWVLGVVEEGDVIAIDAPLVVTNTTGQRLCEREVGQRYMHPWRVAANSSNLRKSDLAGVDLRHALEHEGIRYIHDFAGGVGTVMFECYPYTTIVGAPELGYDLRPQYKRLNRKLPHDERRSWRAKECDELIRRMCALGDAQPPIHLDSHAATAGLFKEPSPWKDAYYKHREDLLDAAICAWTAAIWAVGGVERMQILGGSAEMDEQGRRPVIFAPAKPEQRR